MKPQGLIEKEPSPKCALDIPWDWSGFPISFYPKTVPEKIETLL